MGTTHGNVEESHTERTSNPCHSLALRPVECYTAGVANGGDSGAGYEVATDSIITSLYMNRVGGGEGDRESPEAVRDKEEQ